MIEFCSTSTYFAVTLALVCYVFADALQKKFKSPLLNPLVVSSIIVIVLLVVLDIPNEDFQAGCQVLNYLLTPATICLAISFYEKFQTLKHYLPAVIAGVLAGIVCSLGSVYILCKVCGVDSVVTLSLLPKSITTAMGMGVSAELGGMPAVTVASIVITGIFGNVVAGWVLKLFRVKHPVAQGLACGTAAHAIGTARAREFGAVQEAMSGLSIAVCGLMTVVIASFYAMIQF